MEQVSRKYIPSSFLSGKLEMRAVDLSVCPEKEPHYKKVIKKNHSDGI